MAEQKDPVYRATRALDRVYRTRRAADEALESFHRSIRVAVELTSVRQVADAAGLSKTRVHQIVHGRNR